MSTVIYNDQVWELVPFNELSSLTGEVVLIWNEEQNAGGLIEIIRVSCATLLYAAPSSWSGCTSCSVCEEMYYDSSFYFLPYRLISSERSGQYCYCGGPSIDKWCYYSNKIEQLCCRCRKRKTK